MPRCAPSSVGGDEGPHLSSFVLGIVNAPRSRGCDEPAPTTAREAVAVGDSLQAVRVPPISTRDVVTGKANPLASGVSRVLGSRVARPG